MVTLQPAVMIWVLSSSVLFVVFSLLRFSLNLGIIERPLVQGLVWGVITGDVTTAVSVSLVFELLWLDLIPAGTFIPPNLAASNLSALALVTIFNMTAPTQAIFPILLGMPVGWIASRLEGMHRGWQNTSFNQLQAWLKPDNAEPFAPHKLVRRALIQAGTVYLLFYLVLITALVTLTSALLTRGFLQPEPGLFAWGHLWLAASIGAFFSLRVSRGYVVLALGALGVCVLALFSGA